MNEHADEELDSASGQDIVDKGLVLRFFSEDDTTVLPRVYAIPYQRINDVPGPEILVDDQRLLELQLLPNFDHVALDVVTSGVDRISEIALQAKESPCKGLILSCPHSSFPVLGVPSLADLELDFPVLLVQTMHGDDLTRELRGSRIVTVSIRKTPCLHDFLEHWNPPAESGVDSKTLPPVSETKETMTRKTNSLVARLRELMYGTFRSRSLRSVSVDAGRFQTILKLFESFSNECSTESIEESRFTKEVVGACKMLIKIAEKSFLDDFPFHCILARKLSRLSTEPYGNGIVKSVKQYEDLCVGRLGLIEEKVIKTTFNPFVRRDWRVWDGTHSPLHLMYSWLRQLYHSRHTGPESCTSNSMEDFNISCVAFLLIVALHCKVKRDEQSCPSWSTFVKDLRCDRLPWSSSLLDHISRKLKLTKALKLKPNEWLGSDVTGLTTFIEVFGLGSLGQLRETVRKLFSVLSGSEYAESWLETTEFCKRWAENHIGVRNIVRNSEGGDIARAVEEARGIALLFYQLSPTLSLGDISEVASLSFENTEEDASSCSFELSSDQIAQKLFEWYDFVMSSVLDIFHSDWTRSVTSLRMDIPSSVGPRFNERVNMIAMKHLRSLSPQQFSLLITDIVYLRKEVVRTYLQEFESAVLVQLGSKDWIRMLRTVQKQWPDLMKDVLGLLGRVANKYITEHTRPDDFLIELLRLSQPENCPHLFCARQQQDTFPLFSEFLIRFLSTPKVTRAIRNNFKQVLNSLGKMGESPLRESVIKVFCQVIVPHKNEFRHAYPAEWVRAFIEILCQEVITLSSADFPLDDEGYKCHATWRMLLECCRGIKPENLDLSDPPFIGTLGRVFPALWPESALTTPSDLACKAAYKVTPDEMNEYRLWFLEVKTHLERLRKQFLEGFVSTHELDNYQKNCVLVEGLYRCFTFRDWDCETKVTGMLQAVINLETQLNRYVYYQTKERSQWVGIWSLLTKWQVQYDVGIVRKVKACLEPLSNRDGTDAQSRTSFRHIRVSKNVLFVDIQHLENQVHDWMEPISDTAKTLLFFSSCSSELFRAILHDQISGMRFQQSLSERSTSLVCETSFENSNSIIGEPHSSELDMNDFNNALLSTKDKLWRLRINNTSLQELDSLRLQYYDVDTEIKALLEFPEFVNEGLATADIGSLESLLIVLNYRRNLQSIDSFYKTFLPQNWNSDKKFQVVTDKLQLLLKPIEEASTDFEKLTLELDTKLCGRQRDKLRLFDAVQHSLELVDFVRKNEFLGKLGRESFRHQVELVRNQEHDDQFVDTTFTHLGVVFECFLPFIDTEVTFSELIEILNSSPSFEMRNWKDPLRNVNRNLNKIKFHFSKAQGDTVQNVGQDLEAILSNGRYEFFPELSDGEHCSGGIVLRFTLSAQPKATQINVEPIPLQPDITTSPFSKLPLSTQETGLVTNLDGMECDGERYPSPGVYDRSIKGSDLDEFLRKLGFLKNDPGSGNQSDMAKQFLRKNVLFKEVFSLCLQLYRLKHPKLSERTTDMVFPVSMSESDIQAEMTRYRNDLSSWNESVSALRQRYPKLLCFSMLTLSQISQAIDDKDFSTATELVSGLFESNGTTTALLKKAIASVSDCLPHEDDYTRSCYLNSVGALVVALTEDHQLRHHSLPDQVLSSLGSRDNSGHTVHLAYGFTSEQVLRLIVQIYLGLPQSFEFLWCNSLTTKGELDLFLQRASAFDKRLFVLVEVNMLISELQEHLYKYQLNETRSGRISVHYIVTNRLAFQEAPWINIRAHKEEDLISQQEAKKICKETVGKRCGFEAILSVCGRAGDGKSHYIRKKLQASKSPVCTIAVHEGFSEDAAIEKLRGIKDSSYSQIFFNITMSPPRVGEDAVSVTEGDEFQNVLIKFNWFLFKLIGLGFVHSDRAGISIRIKSGCKWTVYVEVPSIQNDCSGHQSLQIFQKSAPFVSYVSSVEYISPEVAFDVDDDVQLVCKFLRAYDIGRLNRTYSDARKKLVSIANDPFVPPQACEELLRKYMPNDVRSRKITQRLFVQYMNRRCRALESCHFFQFYQGMVCKNIDTRNFGSVLMKVMLNEVSRFCTPKANNDLSFQQLVYDSSGGSTTFHFLSLNPTELTDTDVQKLTTMGLNVPDETELNNRKNLDFYLSKGLNVNLDGASQQAAEAASNADEKRCPNPIDQEGYVLTADYMLKMLSIHERRLCGMSVIIEGDTGVGKTRLLQMLSVLWNTSIERSRQLARERIVAMLQQKALSLAPEVAEAAIRIIDSIGKGCDPPPCQGDVRTVCTACYKEVFRVLLDPDTVKYDSHAPYLVPLDITAAREWKTAEGTAELLTAIMSANTWNTFHKCYIHSGLTPNDIGEFLRPLFQLAKRIADQAMVLGGDIVPTVVVFFDEINTSSCMGIMKELLIDRTFNGESIPSNVFLVAACNPHRNRIPRRSKTELCTTGVYRVRQLSPSIQFLLWDYGSLSQHQEAAYVTEKIRMLTGGNVDLDVLRRKDLICRAQETVRKLALEQLQRDGAKYEDCLNLSRCFVSQRDIQRVFDLADFLQRVYEKDCPDRAEKGIHATIVSLGIVYYLRLNESSRKTFAAAIDNMLVGTTDNSFREMLEGEIHSFVKRLHIPRGIAMTKALAENLFSIVVCTACRIPVIIAGPPGSSKTLSFKLALMTLRGGQYRTSIFCKTDLFPYLDLYHYQCSRRTTSKEIDHVFKRAMGQQEYHLQVGWHYNSVVFMDEVGLPTDKDDSLKALHQYLDDQCVAFVGITNRELDPANSNRAINVYRPESDEEDLRTLARACLCKSTTTLGVDLESALPTVDKLISAYAEVMKDSQFCTFFGLRDFMHLMHYIRRNCDIGTGISTTVILRAVERNFSGVEKDQFLKIVEIFKGKLNVSPDSKPLPQRGIISILSESLEDQSLSDSVDIDGVEAEVRFKLIVDKAEDDSLLDLLFASRVLNEDTTCVFTCSDFSGDADVQRINVIADIRQAAEEGKTVLLSHTEDINESFYDLFNQSLKYLDHPQQGKMFFANIAIGSHSKLCRVHPQFQCILHIRSCRLEKSDIPCPLLNRFEKFLVSQEDILTMVLDQPYLKPLKEACLVATDKVRDFVTVFGRDKFYGATSDTVTSAFLDIVLCKAGYERSPWGHCTELPKRLMAKKDEDDQDDSLDKERWAECASHVVSNLETVLRDQLNLNVSPKNLPLQKLQAQSVFGAVKQLLDGCDFDNCTAELTEDPSLIRPWFLKAQEVLIDTEKYKGQNEILRNTTFVVATTVQLLAFYGSIRILQLAVPEAVIAQHSRLPRHWFGLYLEHQTHFSLADLVNKAQVAFSPDHSQRPYFDGLVCFTKTTSFIHSLPSMFFVDSHEANSTDPDEAQSAVRRLLQKTDISSVALLKLDQVKTSEDLDSFLVSFISSERKCICILLANMEICRKERINNVRLTIKNFKRTCRSVGGKLFVLLLHYPPSTGRTNPCYPSHFLRNWDLVYLDSVVEKEEMNVVDICPWIRAATCSDETTMKNDYASALEKSLFSVFPMQLDVVVPRVQFGDDSGCQINRKMDAAARLRIVKEVFQETPGLMSAVCRKFVGSWTVMDVQRLLLAVARRLDKTVSCLSVKDKFQSGILSRFRYFLVAFLAQLNEDYNLDVLCRPHDQVSNTLISLFVSIVKLLPCPQPKKLALFDFTFHRPYVLGKVGKTPGFPFFGLVSRTVDQVLGRIVGEYWTVTDTVQGKSVSHQEDSQRRQISMPFGEAVKAISDQFLQILESKGSSVYEHDVTIAKMALQAVSKSEIIWRLYLADFVSTRFGPWFGQPDTDDSNLVCLMLGNLSKYELGRRFVFLHTVTRLQPVSNLAFWLATPRGRKAVSDVQSTHRNDPQSLDFFEVLQGCAINSFYDDLKNVQSSPATSETAIVQLCHEYQSVAANLRFANSGRLRSPDLRPKLQSLETVVAFVTSLEETSSVGNACGLLVQNICQVCDQVCSLDPNTKEFPDLIDLPMRKVMTNGLDYLQIATFCSTQDSTSDKVFERSARNFVRKSLAVYCPLFSRGLPPVCSMESIRWLLTEINSSEVLSSVKETGENAERRKKYSIKDCLPADNWLLDECFLRILQLDVGSIDDRTGFGRKIRMMTEEILDSNSIRCKDSATPVSVKHPKIKTIEDQWETQALAYTYFRCCQRQIRTKWKASTLSNLMKAVEQIKKDALKSNIVEKRVLHLDFQAFVQLVISDFAKQFRREDLYSGIIENINAIFCEAESNGFYELYLSMFMHHLHQHLRSTRKLALFISRGVELRFRSSFAWMTQMQAVISARRLSHPYVWPFLRRLPTTEASELNSLYTTVLRMVGTVAKAAKRGNRTKEKEGVSMLMSYCSSKEEYSQHQLRLVVYLCIYEQFFDSKVKSTHLAESIAMSDIFQLVNCQKTMLACLADSSRLSHFSQVTTDSHSAEVDIKPNQRPRKTSDRVWDILNPKDSDSCKEDTHADLRRAVAFLGGIALAVPTVTTHLWTHIFDPQRLEGNLVPGSPMVCRLESSSNRYDSICTSKQWEDVSWGGFGPLNRQLLYVLQWMSYGCFCWALMTQPDTVSVLQRTVVSGKDSIQVHCASELRRLWNQLRENLGLSEEERTFLVFSILEGFLKSASSTNSPLQTPVLDTIACKEKYERAFRENVFWPALKEFDRGRSLTRQLWYDSPWTSDIKEFSFNYEDDISFDDCALSMEYHWINADKERQQQLGLLYKFFQQRELLYLCSQLLPDLIEFYHWLHQKLNHLVTRNEASRLTIGKVIENVPIPGSRDNADEIRLLFQSVCENYNKYLLLTADAPRNRKLISLQMDTPLDCLLSIQHKQHSGDVLFLVIDELVEIHNEFVQKAPKSAPFTDETEGGQSPLEEPRNRTTTSPLHLALGNCVVHQSKMHARTSDTTHNFHETFLMLCSSCCLGPTTDETDRDEASVCRYQFDFDGLQTLVLETFCLTTTPIDNPECIRVAFRFRNDLSQVEFLQRDECYINLSTFEENLPETFQDSLSEPRRRALATLFHNVDYWTMTDIMKGLRTTAEHFLQNIEDNQNIARTTTPETVSFSLSSKTVGEFLQEIYQDGKLSERVQLPVIPRVDEKQLQEMLNIPLCQLYATLSLFVEKFLNCEYEYAHVPLSLKMPLPDDCQDFLQHLENYCAKSTNTGQSFQILRNLDQTLLHAEGVLVKNPKMTMREFLVGEGKYDMSQLPVGNFPETLLVEHYMEFRLSLTRIITSTSALKYVNTEVRSVNTILAWTETVDSLDQIFPHLFFTAPSMTRQLPLMALAGPSPLCFDEPQQSLHSYDATVASDEESSIQESIGEPDSSSFEVLHEGESIVSSSSFPVKRTSPSPSLFTINDQDSLFSMDFGNDTTVDGSDSDKKLSEKEDSDDAEDISETNPRSLTGRVVAKRTTPIPIRPAPHGTKLDIDQFMQSTLSRPEGKQVMRQWLQSHSSELDMPENENLGDLSHMSEDDVTEFLKRHGLEQYVDVFNQNEADGATLQKLDDFVLKKYYKVNNPDERHRILDSIRDLRKQQN